MRHFGLIGEHLGHSLSVPIHQAIFARENIDADYVLLEIPRCQLITQTLQLMEKLDGLNVTIPYKQDVISVLAQVNDTAARIGAVNTIDCHTRCGYNTDAAGFTAMLRHHGMDPKGQKCFVMGAGGASKAVVAALHAMGAAQVTLVSRTPRDGMIGYEELLEQFSGLLVNCTPVGMYPKPDACPLTEEMLRSMLPCATGVADLIYNPSETRLTAAAKAAGVPACTGLYMLVAQAVEAERIWQGRDFSEELTHQVMRDMEERKLL